MVYVRCTVWQTGPKEFAVKPDSEVLSFHEALMQTDPVYAANFATKEPRLLYVSGQNGVPEADLAAVLIL